MKVVVAPNAFKGSLSPLAAAHAIENGLRRAGGPLECDIAPVSDGGDGFLEVMLAANPVTRRKVVVRGPLHTPVAATYAVDAGGAALIEAAAACGIALLDADSLDPLGASTGGVGELLAQARQEGPREVIVGLGGSASTDAGTGMARALGYRFLNAGGAELPEGGGSLHLLDRIDSSGFDPAWMMLPATVACDVDNPLFGAAGSAAVYSPQKGADPAQVEILDVGLRRAAEVMRRDLGLDVADQPGAGAAGGLGAGLAGFGARLESGSDLVMRSIRLEQWLFGADLLVTGEGRLDSQSLRGKAAVGVGQMARRLGVRAVALVGALGHGWEEARDQAFDDVRVVAPEGMDAEEAIARAGELVAAAAESLLRD